MTQRAHDGSGGEALPAPVSNPTGRDLARRLLERMDADQTTWLATLVERDGHGYHAPGAHLLIDPSGDAPTPITGRLSGGCLEDEVAYRAGMLRAPAGIVELDTADDGPYGLGLACGGRLRILVETIDPGSVDAPAWRDWAETLRSGRSTGRWMDEAGTWAWTAGAEVRFRSAAPVPSAAHRRRLTDLPRHEPSPDVHARVRPVRDGWRESVPRPPRLIVIGTEDDGIAVARTMLHHGWQVRIVTPARAKARDVADALDRATGRRPEVLTADAEALAEATFEADDRVLAAARRLDLDAAAVASALRSGVRWCGAVASRHRREALLRTEPLATLAQDAPDALLRLEAPVAQAAPVQGAEEVASAVAMRLVEDLRQATRPVWAVLPAAGASSRLGSPKPLLSDGDETLIERAERLAESTCDGTVVVTATDALAVEARLGPASRVVRLRSAERGLGASLRAGLRGVPEGSRALVHLPDMPGVDADHLAVLRREGARASGAVSRYPDGGVGAPALLPDALVAAARADDADDAVEASRASAEAGTADRGFAAQLRTHDGLARVPLLDPTDVDDPETAEARGWAQVPD